MNNVFGTKLLRCIFLLSLEIPFSFANCQVDGAVWWIFVLQTNAWFVQGWGTIDERIWFILRHCLRLRRWFWGYIIFSTKEFQEYSNKRYTVNKINNKHMGLVSLYRKRCACFITSKTKSRLVFENDTYFVWQNKNDFCPETKAPAVHLVTWLTS